MSWRNFTWPCVSGSEDLFNRIFLCIVADVSRSCQRVSGSEDLFYGICMCIVAGASRSCQRVSGPEACCTVYVYCGRCWKVLTWTCQRVGRSRWSGPRVVASQPSYNLYRGLSLLLKHTTSLVYAFLHPIYLSIYIFKCVVSVTVNLSLINSLTDYVYKCCY